MKKWLYNWIIFGMLVVLGISATATSAFAWNQSFHAYVAKKCLRLDNRYIASYNARMGSMVPDFFWYLRDSGLIDPETADRLHGYTEEKCVSDETTYFYEIASGLLAPWNYRLKFFAKGIRTHVFADIIAHNSQDGYLEGEDKWIDILRENLSNDDKDNPREVLHLALEFAVDALLVNTYGFQLNDLLFSYSQANFVEEAVEEVIGSSPDFDASQEFKKYLGLMRALEKAAALYAPYLMKGMVDEQALKKLEDSELLEAQPELSEESLDIYVEVLLILLKYPAQIHQTITEDGMHWKKDALKDAIEFCMNPVICP